MTKMNNNHQLLAIDAWLRSLKLCSFYNDYIVRGSYVSRHWLKYPRQCHDLDLLYQQDYKLQDLIDHVKQVAHDAHDISFNTQSMTYEEIWKDTISPGARFILPYQWQGEQHNLQIDIASNDPLVSPPVEQSFNQVTFRTVTVETLAAWKLHGLFEHINGPWQSKTVWDLYLLCRYNSLDEALFIKATELAFSSRLDPLEIITRLLQGDFGQSKKSEKYWQIDFPQFTSTPIVSLGHVIRWLQAYLSSVFHFTVAEPLLTQADIIRYRVVLLRSMDHPQAANKLKALSQKRKILATKAYHTIHHLPTSRLGSSERCISDHQYKLLTDKAYQQEGNEVIVQEKLDGSCVCAYRKDDQLFALGRAGDLAESSSNESRRLWAAWLLQNEDRFMAILNNGERLCGEWLAMVHGTHYDLTHEPFVGFDLFTAANMAVGYHTLKQRLATAEIILPYLIHSGEPISLDFALEGLGQGHHGSTDQPEGLIWRLERTGKPAFKAKYVRHDKEDGCYLTEKTGEPEQWNRYPQ